MDGIFAVAQFVQIDLRPEHTFHIVHLRTRAEWKAVSSTLKQSSGRKWYTVRRLQQNKQKTTEVSVAALLFFYHF